MDIIFLSSTKGKICSLGFCNPLQYILAIIVITSIIGFSVFFGYKLGVSPDYQAEISNWKTEITQQKASLAHLQQKANANVDALSSRIGLIQAHMLRLDALGRRIMDLSKLKGEFDFENIPALGGPAALDSITSDNILLTDSIDKVSEQLEKREKQLLILEDLLLYDIVASDIKPIGKPIIKGWLSSYYGMRTHPISGKNEMHKGIDFAGKFGDPVVSVARGIVSFVGKKYGYGRVIDIEHGNNYATRYGHNSKILVAVGDQVEKNTQIAEMGSSGRSTGPHVHFEVIKKGRQIDPIKFIRTVN